MSITLDLDEETVERVKHYATGRNVSLEVAVSEILRKAASEPMRTKVVNGLVIFDPPADSPMVTNELIDELKAEF
jgi:hypothetical protein